MDYPIALDPELEVDAEDFAAAWNDAAECRALAEARAVDQPLQGFPLDPQLVQQGLVVLSGVAGAAGALALDALKDALQARLAGYLEKKLSRKPAIQVKTVRQPGGAVLLVVTEGEG
jgi:hypothetical protein